MWVARGPATSFCLFLPPPELLVTKPNAKPQLQVVSQKIYCQMQKLRKMPCNDLSAVIIYVDFIISTPSPKKCILNTGIIHEISS